MPAGYLRTTLICLCLQAGPLAGLALGAAVTQLTPDVYLFRHDFHSNIFVVTDEGVVVTDPISPRAAAACLEEIRKITDQPIQYVIYSHEHSDHIAGGAVFQPQARFVAHRNAVPAIAARKSPDIVMPDILVDERHTIELGGKLIELVYLGRIESASNLAIFLPQDRVLMWVDAVRSFGVPYRHLEGTDLNDLRSALGELQTWDFEYLIPGHGPATDKARLELYSRYFDDLQRFAEAEMVNYTQTEHRSSLAGDVNPEKYFDTYISRVAAAVVERMRARYAEMGGFDDWGPKNAERMVVFLLHEQVWD